MSLSMAEQLVSVGFAVAIGVGAGALIWQPRALAAGDGDGDAVPVLDDHLAEPWPERVVRGIALLAVAFAATLIYVAAAV